MKRQKGLWHASLGHRLNFYAQNKTFNINDLYLMQKGAREGFGKQSQAQ